jgi:hypothetical protein
LLVDCDKKNKTAHSHSGRVNITKAKKNAPTQDLLTVDIIDQMGQ